VDRDFSLALPIKYKAQKRATASITTGGFHVRVDRDFSLALPIKDKAQNVKLFCKKLI